MADSNPIQQQLLYHAFNITPDQQQKLMSAQQQEAMANALLQQGTTPISTEGRSIGGVGYKISPLEGLAKMADLISGKYQQNDANSALANALVPQSKNNPSGNSSVDNISGTQTPSTPPSQSGQEGPLGQFSDPRLMAMLYPEEAAKAVIANMYADHRPGASYFDPNTQQRLNAPTDQMLNTGTAPSATPPQAPRMPPQAVNPMSGAVGAPPSMPPPAVGGGMPSPPPAPVSQGPIPPMNASALNAPPSGGIPVPPTPAGIQLSRPPPGAIPPPPPSGMATPMGSFPPPSPGQSAAERQAQLAILQAQQTKQAEIAPAVEQAKAVAQATQQGEGLGKAQVGASTVASRFDNAQDLISKARDSAKNASYGMGTGLKEEYHNQMNDPTSVANADYQNHMSQLLTQAIPAIVQSTGGRIDIPLLNAIKEAENADISLSPAAKSKVLDDLSVALNQQRQNMNNQVSNLGGTPQPFTPAQPQNAVTHIFVPGKGIQAIGGQ